MCEINWHLVLQFTKVFLSWPVVALTLGLTIIWLFKQEISRFLSRVTKGKGYGVEFEAASPQELRPTGDISSTGHVITDDSEKWVVEHPKEAIAQYNTILNGYRWERAFNLIYGTQIHLLEYLSGKGDIGEAYVGLAIFHNEHQKRVDNTNYTIVAYMEFLKAFGFIQSEGEQPNINVKITPYGLEFLSYIKASYPAVYSSKPF